MFIYKTHIKFNYILNKNIKASNQKFHIKFFLINEFPNYFIILLVNN